MSRSFIGRLIGAGSGIVIGILTFVVSMVFTGNVALAAGTPTPTGGSTTTATTTPLFTTDSPFFIYFLLILFVFGLALIVGLLFYIYKIQIKYYSTAQSLSQIGIGVKALPLSPSWTLSKGKDELQPTQQPRPLKIDGPGVVTVGAQAEFTATTDESHKPASNTVWSIDPPDAASFSGKGEGEKVTVIPLKMGPITLTAKTIDPPGSTTVTEQGSSTFAAVASQTTEELPLLGQGYGSLVIAVLVVLAVVLLALTGYLTGEAVATLFGGLLGYIFGVTTSAATTSSKKSNGKTAGGGS